MIRNQTLRTRIIIYFCLYLGIILILYSTAISGLMNMAQDFAFENQLSELTDKIKRSIKKNNRVPDLPPHFKLYTHRSEIPGQLLEHIGENDFGIIEIDKGISSVHVSIFKAPPGNKRFYLLYDVEDYELSEEIEFYFSLALLGIGILIMIAGAFLSLIIAKRIMTPITSLAKTVEHFSPDKPFTPLTEYNANDEIGMLVETINGLIRRTDDFVRREREFTLFASHELRNPVSVIKGAQEILEIALGPDHENLEVLERISFSAKELDTLISTFLTLARLEKNSTDFESFCELDQVVKNVVESFSFLLDGKPVEIVISAEGSGSLKAPEHLVSVAVGNLIRNSFQYTMEGKVEITTGEEFISVVDTGPGVDEPKSGTGTGLGLLIVTRLCEYMGWRKNISQLPSGGTRAELFFKP